MDKLSFYFTNNLFICLFITLYGHCGQVGLDSAGIDPDALCP